MKKIKILFVFVFIFPALFTASYAQSGGISPKGDKEEPFKPKEREGGQYQDFELTSENIEWAKAEVKKEKDRAEVEFDEGKITAEEYKSRMGKIAQAEKKIKEFESSSAITSDPAHGEGQTTGGNETGNTPGEIVSKSDIQKNKDDARKERERIKREQNKAKANAKRIETQKENIKTEKHKLEKEKKEGKISAKEYDERMKRLIESEERLNNYKGMPKETGKGSSENSKSGKYEKDRVEPIEKESLKKSATHSEIHKEQESKELHKTIDNGEKKIADAKIRVQKSKQQIEKDKKSGKITQQQYDQKMLQIKRVEAAIKDLESDVSKGKELK